MNILYFNGPKFDKIYGFDILKNRVYDRKKSKNIKIE